MILNRWINLIYELQLKKKMQTVFNWNYQNQDPWTKLELTFSEHLYLCFDNINKKNKNKKPKQTKHKIKNKHIV